MDRPLSDDGESTADALVAAAAAAGGHAAGGNMLAHISMRGDVIGRAGEWLGEPGSRLAIEAIALAPPGTAGDLVSPAVECQLMYQKGLKTPWTKPGQPCGSAGFGLSCLGMRFRLSAETAPFFECHYDIAFIDGTRQDEVPGREMALSSSGAAVEAIRLRVTPREPAPLILLNDLDDEPAPTDRDDIETDPTVRLRLLSPAFATGAPTIRNAASIPAGPWRAMAASFERRVFAGRIVKLRLISDAIVVGEGVVFDRSLALVPGTDRLTPQDSVALYRQQAEEGAGAGMRRIAGLSVLCKTRAPQNFGNFLMDMYTKAWLAAQLLTKRPATYIVHETDMLGLVRDALTHIGINPFAISVTDNQPVQCEQLVVIDGLTAHGTYQSPISVQALTQLAEGIPAAPFPKLFIRRHAQQRRLHNQEAVETLMRQRATTVVGPLGAALTNIAFCPTGSKVVALTPQSFPDTFFWFLCQHRGHDYVEVRGLDASGKPDETQSWIAGFTMSDEDLAFLASL
jgi:hypothetical protein